MEINVVILNGKQIKIEVQIEKTTVNDIKKKVMEKSGIRFEDLVLIYNNQILKNDQTLKNSGIDKGVTIDAETADTLTKKYKQKIEEEVNKWRQKFSEQQNQKEEFQEQLTKVTNQMDQIKNQYQQQVAKGNEIEITKLKATISGLEMDKTELFQQIQYFKQEKLDLQQKVEDFLKLKEDLIGKTYEIKGLQKELEYAQNRGNQTKDDIIRELDISRQQIRRLEQQIDEVKTKNKELEVEKVQQQMKSFISSNQNEKLSDLQQQNAHLEKKLAECKSQLHGLFEQVRTLQSRRDDELRASTNRLDLASAERIQNFEMQISKLTAEANSSKKSFEESQIQLGNARKQCFENDKRIIELEKSVESLANQLKENSQGMKEKEKLITELQIQKDELQKDLDLYKKLLQQYKNNAEKGDPKKMSEMDIENKKLVDALNAREEQRNKEYQREEQQRKKELLERQEKLKQEQSKQQDLMQKNKEQRQKTAQFLKRQMFESHGKIEVCFLIDVTGSMDPYKEQAMMCIKESMKNIKIKTNRDALWATVAYQDFEERKQLGGKYKQLNFTPNPKEIEDYLSDIPCAGGGDAAEDIRGGITQMVQNLDWSKNFKIAVLICDAPTHGKRYNGGVADRYPNEDIEDAINLLIEKNILFVAILFNKFTLPMFEEIKKIYQKAEKEELLLFADLENTEQGKIWQELVDLVSQASQRATQTNNKGTRSKQAAANKRSQTGAMEALCKSIKDPSKFDELPGVKTVLVKFGVYRVELKQDAFEGNLENIRRLDINRDYSVYEEGKWDCIRTETFFAVGQMKQVFLMKRISNKDELYVIKMPLGDTTYKSQDEAVVECRSHLISKCLMKKYINELQEARDRTDRTIKIPDVKYSDFLILKDLAQGNSYWIAERFFSGDFVKYNNNYGFISDENIDLNHLAQGYSYYTYFISNFNYMVSDVQGVGNYFTDPALNTKDGNFDLTDMGLDGQSMFMVAYGGKKHMGRKYLDLLGIPQP
ncbi:unnamed protein product (macronuclear) [Paramecium tetraurelia]|uniref:Ubiquitin-like domain-containing protein n=1 Tax=Paramecium tetraurelia TaxID=5888 RepID=A0C4J6_PARTE|nr:uncharacterized protein GSPATT00006211001 [Paramecium tetraurelia]CAK65713.1 unnamed protein product [Paramecium tetraurelia]|eukprot:XP_001433110.1 hypothetical protein (macronuclear) [Paramecium tetraurelia strain d4-2]